jgi:hypothetical protein
MRRKLGQDWPGRFRSVRDMMPGTFEQKKRMRQIVFYLCHVEREEGGPFNAAHFVKELKTACKAINFDYDDRHIRAALVMRKQLEQGEFTEEEYKRADRILKKKR